MTDFTKGRNKIFAGVDSIDASNVVAVVNRAMSIHKTNQQEIQWLFNLYRGSDDRIIKRSRNIENGINNKAFVSYYSLIADVKSGLFTQNSLSLVSRQSDEQKAKDIEQLITYFDLTNKHMLDKEAALQAAICGVAYRFVGIDPYFNKNTRNGHAPFKVSTLAPENVFMIWGDDTDTEPLAAVYMYQLPNEDVKPSKPTGETGQLETINAYKVYTPTHTYSWTDSTVDDLETSKALSWGIPIVEYRLNSFYIGLYERVTSLIYMLSILRSDGVNAVVQYVGSLLFGRNIGVPEPINPQDDAETKKAKEEVIAEFKQGIKNGSIFVEDTKEKPASLEYIAQNLNQADTQVLYEAIIDDIVSITQIPRSALSMGASGNNGAAETSSGWTNAVVDAQNSEPFWFAAARKELFIELEVCKKAESLENVFVDDVVFAMTRESFSNKQSEVQAFAMLVEKGVPWAEAAKIASITTDPENLASKMKHWREQEEKRLANNQSVHSTIVQDEPAAQENEEQN